MKELHHEHPELGRHDNQQHTKRREVPHVGMPQGQGLVVTFRGERKIVSISSYGPIPPIPMDLLNLPEITIIDRLLSVPVIEIGFRPKFMPIVTKSVATST